MARSNRSAASLAVVVSPVVSDVSVTEAGPEGPSDAPEASEPAEQKRGRGRPAYVPADPMVAATAPWLVMGLDNYQAFSRDPDAARNGLLALAASNTKAAQDPAHVSAYITTLSHAIANFTVKSPEISAARANLDAARKAVSDAEKTLRAAEEGALPFPGPSV